MNKLNINDTNALNFDFLKGEWEVTNKYLKERLSDSESWLTFTSRLHGLQKFMNGNLNIDHFSGVMEGKNFNASSIRVYNPVEKTWRIYWVDSNYFEIFPQVEGGFKNGVGVFYGTEKHNGVEFLIRFLWENISEDFAHWTQAYFNEVLSHWEVNWIMDFKRIS